MAVSTPRATGNDEGLGNTLIAYLDAFRSQLIEGVQSLSEATQRKRAVPSGWTPIQLLVHLTFVERRWIEWGFEGIPMDDPFGDHRDEKWFVPDDLALDVLVAELIQQGVHTASVLRSVPLSTIGAESPRWRGANPPTLERIALHLMSEYARHLGHLDIVVEQSTVAS